MTNRKRRLGLIIDYINSEYSTSLIDGMKAACSDFDIQLFIFSVGELHNYSVPYDYQLVSIAALITKNNLDGVIMTSGSQMHYLTKAELSSYIKSFQPLPLVNISVEFPTIPSIIVDSFSAYETIINDLIENQKCKKFCVISVRGNSAEVKSRTKDIKTALQKKFVPSDDVTILKSVFDYGTTYTLLGDFYTNNNNQFDYDAIIAMNDEMAFAAMDFCHSINKRIPQDVAIVGFDDLERSSFSNPTLTSITQDISGQAYAAVVYMREILEGRSETMLKKVDAKPILRDSTCRFSPMKGKGDKENTLSATEWYSKKSQLYHITHYYTDMQTDITIDTLQQRMNDDMKSFGLKACAIVTYASPVEMATPFDFFNLPHKAILFSAFDYSTFYDSAKNKKRVVFDPNETMIPEGVLYEEDGEMYVMALFHNTIQYGYMIFRPGNFDISIYDLLCRFLGTIISSVYSYEQAHSEQSKFKAKNKQLGIIARTDELTGLLNRRGFFDLGKTTLKFAKEMNQSGLVVYCDMDGLKKINDTYGHESGDNAIVAEAALLKKSFRSNDVVARIGGDEFVIISPGLTEESFARIRKNIEEECAIWQKENQSPFSLSISMGAVAYPSTHNGYSIINLLADADSKLYEEKNRKKKNK